MEHYFYVRSDWTINLFIWYGAAAAAVTDNEIIMIIVMKM